MCEKKQWESMILFTSELHVQSPLTFQLQQRLRKSVQNDCEGFTLFYQPIISADKHIFTGVEALLRWSEAKFPAASPAEFIPVLENFGDIHKVGKWVLATALEQVEKRNFPRHQLVLELIDSCNIINPKDLARDLDYFREHGIQIALDDFGTGYASLSVLRDLTTDWIKIGQTFVAQIADNDFDKALTECLINLCSKLGLRVCVEGIKTKEIQNVIQCFHPDILQGYYYSRPVDTKTFEENFLGKSI